MTFHRKGRTLAATALLAVLATACGGGHSSTASNASRPSEAPGVTEPAAAATNAAAPAAAVTADDLKQTDAALNAVDSELAGADAGLATDEGDLTK